MRTGGTRTGGRRFCNPKVTLYGRIGHPGAIDRRMVKCSGVKFADRATGNLWTLRKYEAYPPDWPAMDVWTVQQPMHTEKRRPYNAVSYSNQTRVEEADVPEEVRLFALAELVRLRLRGKVWS